MKRQHISILRHSNTVLLTSLKRLILHLPLSLFSSLRVMFEKQHLIELATVEMPFGKYSGRKIIDLPEEYLLWFKNKGFPEGKLGLLMALALEIKIEGLENLIEPLKGKNSRYTFH